MDPIKTIGQILSKDEDRRDAIHIAIMPVTLSDEFGVCIGGCAGIRVRVENGVAYPCATGEKSIGIIDPFVIDARRGDRVWMFLHPGTITGMRHQWTHPEIDARSIAASDATASIQAALQKDSREWLRQFAGKWHLDFDELISQAQSEEGSITADGIDLHSTSDFDAGEADEFWHHIEVLTGKTFDNEHRGRFSWSCSC